MKCRARRYLDLRLGEEGWSLHAFGTARPTVSGGVGEPQFSDYQVHMTGRGRIAVVFSDERQVSELPPYILWVGDLDSDRVPDIFAELSYCTRRYVLFLSLLAREGQFVSEAASLTLMGC